MEQINYSIPLFELDIGEEELQGVGEVLKSKWLTMGEVTRQFEEAFSRYLDVKHCIAVSNGTAALHLAIMALGIGPGDEVICPSLTFVATANSILYAGAKPVFADIEGKHDLNISPASIESKISDRTKGILVVHYGGVPCQMERILSIASTYGLKVIEDAAHAPGAEFIWRDGEGKQVKSQKVGTIGDIGCFSFFSNKNLSTGEGGMVVTKDQELAAKIRLMRSHGMTSLTLDRYKGHAYSYDVIDLGYNYRIDELRSALGIVQLVKLKGRNERRGFLDALYRKKLMNVEGIEIPFHQVSHTSAHHIFPILLGDGLDREKTMEILKQKGIQTSIHYPPIHQFSYYRRSFVEKDNSLYWTEYAGAHELTLPLYPLLSEAQIDYICESVCDAIRQ